jgi:hypothetical protein
LTDARDHGSGGLPPGCLSHGHESRLRIVRNPATRRVLDLEQTTEIIRAEGTTWCTRRVAALQNYAVLQSPQADCGWLLRKKSGERISPSEETV